MEVASQSARSAISSFGSSAAAWNQAARIFEAPSSNQRDVESLPSSPSTPFTNASARRVAMTKFSQPGIGFHAAAPYVPPVMRRSGEQSTTAIGYIRSGCR